MENKNQTRTPVEAAQKPGIGSNQAQSNVRAPQGSQSSSAQKAITSHSDESQKSASDRSRADKDLKKDDSFKTSSKDSRKN